jgi:hypothetical protein
MLNIDTIRGVPGGIHKLNMSRLGTILPSNGLLHIFLHVQPLPQFIPATCDRLIWQEARKSVDSIGVPRFGCHSATTTRYQRHLASMHGTSAAGILNDPSQIPELTHSSRFGV